MSKNYFRLDWPLDYAAWRSVHDRATEPEPETIREYHSFVVRHWGGDYRRAAAWALLLADGYGVGE